MIPVTENRRRENGRWKMEGERKRREKRDRQRRKDRGLGGGEEREIWGKHSDQGEGVEERRGEEAYVK